MRWSYKGYRSLKISVIVKFTSNLVKTVEGAPQTPVVEQSKTNKLTEIASSFVVT
ncbi:MAG: hypothetical protein CM15mV5_0800 [uncultured marine virus]|nr:MAG: hypothetical protein CM15mV5_0800 [uncultured marine virus]